MNMIHKIQLDMLEQSEIPRIQVKQGDAFTRTVQITLTAGGEAWTIPTGAQVMIRYHAHDPVMAQDANGIYDTLEGETAWEASENVVTITLAPQMLSEHGLVRADLVFIQGEKLLATATFEIYVNQAVVNDMVPRLADYYGIGGLEQVTAQLQEELDQLAETTAALQTRLEELDAQKLPLSGGEMTGQLSMGGNAITNVAVPVSSYDAANRAFVEQTVASELRSVTNGLETELQAITNGMEEELQAITDDLAEEAGKVDVLLDTTTTSEVKYVGTGVTTGQKYSRIAVMCQTVGTASNSTCMDLVVVINGGDAMFGGTKAGYVYEGVGMDASEEIWADVSIFSGGHYISASYTGPQDYKEDQRNLIFFRHSADLSQPITSIRVQTQDWDGYFGVGTQIKILGIRA